MYDLEYLVLWGDPLVETHAVRLRGVRPMYVREGRAYGVVRCLSNGGSGRGVWGRVTLLMGLKTWLMAEG
ncbi:MAG: hypothetical protein LUF85_10235 [Bacteroides sp.]|nr:hypothetical protein [Bacteroides sp.]